MSASFEPATDAGRLLVRALDAAIVCGDATGLDRCLHPRCVFAIGRRRHARSEFSGLLEQLRVIAERSIVITHGIEQSPHASARFAICGRHVAPWRGVVPTGRMIDVPCHAHVRATSGQLTAVWLHVDAIATLDQTGVVRGEDAEPRRAEVPWSRIETLLSGKPERTNWALRWKLAPRYARVAVLTMSGLPVSFIADALALSLATARTYTKHVYASAGVHGANALLFAARSMT